ncbi:hypothetical protein JTE90_006995 [Oedothorax gibbosus]|uniref:Uncharacterized protein n=1 Tax=Oedothorax gibbosus TaxID=931172 RepID=A0AAV6V942_9ARAC|nr:hypothetical protein JTE90_006995 [Oedothorax gibbosus]
MNFSEFRKKSNLSTLHGSTVRLDLDLKQQDATFYNSFNYKALAQTTDNRCPPDEFSSNTYNWLVEYEDESYIDNTELYPDLLPLGTEPELGGFFVNEGQLKMKCVVEPFKFGNVNQEKEIVRNPIKKPIISKKMRKKDFGIQQPKPNLSKKRGPKNDVNAKLDSILMVLLKGRMNAQNPSANINSKEVRAFRFPKAPVNNIPVIRHDFLSFQPRIKLPGKKLVNKI